MSVTDNGIVTVSAGAEGVSTLGPVTISCSGASQSDAMMVVCVDIISSGTTPINVTSFTDSEGNTWQLLVRYENASGWDAGNTGGGIQRSVAAEIWYTIGATINSSIDFAVVLDGTCEMIMLATTPKILSYDHTNPFDLNASLPKMLRLTTSAAETLTGIDSDTSDVYPIWFMSGWGTGVSQSNVQFTAGESRTDQDFGGHNASEFSRVQVAVKNNATGPYSSASFFSPANAANVYLIALVVTGDAQGGGGGGPPVNLTNLVITQ